MQHTWHISPSSRHAAQPPDIAFFTAVPAHLRLVYIPKNVRRQTLFSCHALPDYKIARKPLDKAVASGSRFPWRDSFELSKDTILDASTIMDTLKPLMTDERIARIEQVCAHRTFNVLPIVEHPYDWGNVAAVCRSADALGCGAVHIIRGADEERYKQSTRTSGGSEKWLDVQLFKTTTECLANARQMGFQIVAAHLDPGAVEPSAIDWTRPTAIVFGNELQGVSQEALAMADATTVLPIDGFVESYNISVAASLLLWEARRLRSQALGTQGHGDLTAEEQHILKAVFFLRNKGLTKQYISHLLRRPPPEWQAHRNKGKWGDKEFESPVAPEDALQKTKCYYWDGSVCWGERVLWPGKRCRYHLAHLQGTSTFNKGKLMHQCAKMGIEVPDVNAAPHVVAQVEAAGGAAALEAAVGGIEPPVPASAAA